MCVCVCVSSGHYISMYVCVWKVTLYSLEVVVVTTQWILLSETEARRLTEAAATTAASGGWVYWCLQKLPVICLLFPGCPEAAMGRNVKDPPCNNCCKSLLHMYRVCSVSLSPDLVHFHHVM